MMFLLVLSFIPSCGGGGNESSSSSGSSSCYSSTPLYASISITPANPNIPVGISQGLAATGTYSNGTSEPITDSMLTWTSSNQSVAQISTTGTVIYVQGPKIVATAVAAGTTTITATLSNFCGGSATGSTTLTVTSATLSSISITPANPNIPVGISQGLVATGTFSDGTSYDITNKVAWASSNSSVATIKTSGGMATTLKAGATTITATMGSMSASTTLTVTSATLSSISITPANPIIPVGLKQQFAAMGTFSDGTSYDITSQVTWSSSDTSKVYVSSGGLATNLKYAGTVTITATKGSISGSTTLTGQGSVPIQLRVKVNWPQSFTGTTTAQATATAINSDDTTQDVTNQVTWSSGTSTASVNEKGLVTIYGTGFVIIKAKWGNLYGEDSATYDPR
jgi:hypothetical protein